MNIQSASAQTVRLLLLPIFFVASVLGGTVSPARTALDAGDATKTIGLLKDVPDKDAEQLYLLGNEADMARADADDLEQDADEAEE